MRQETSLDAAWPSRWPDTAFVTERVARQDVRYLCFEGGGGKGVIYLGAVQALADAGIVAFRGGRLDPNGQIRGIAGSSAGALTAVMLSLGYTPRMLETLVFGRYNFNRFFDLPGDPPQRPTPTGCVPEPQDQFIRAVFGIAGGLALRLLHFASQGADAEASLARKLSSRTFPYLLGLARHMGVFSGCEAHRFFREKIGRRAARRHGQPQNWRAYRDLTFEQHRELFGTELVLTGSNFETGRTALFSAETTPRFPVAAAARISMSLPLIFKPMRITTSQARRLATPSRGERYLSPSDLAGVWVDGGYFNNLPQFAFVHRPNGFRQTLGFSLSDYDARRKRIRTLADFLVAYAEFGLFGTGESQSGVSTGVSPNTVQLVAGNREFQIGLTDFAFRREDMHHVRELISAARTQTLNYFR